MIKIVKYNIPGHCEGNIRQILGVKKEYDKPVVWVMLDDELTEKRAVDFFTVGDDWELTGGDAEIVKQSAYIGTVKDSEKNVVHCFCVSVPVTEEKPEEEVKAEG